jgi:hypothetical protein
VCDGEVDYGLGLRERTRLGEGGRERRQEGGQRCKASKSKQRGVRVLLSTSGDLWVPRDAARRESTGPVFGAVHAVEARASPQDARL